MSELVAFLSARLDEDEAVARDFIDEGDWQAWAAKDMAGPRRDDEYAQLTVGAARVLAEVDAKRRIVAWHKPSTDHGDQFDPYCLGCWEDGGMDGAPSYPCRTIRYVAAVYADHPDYDERWRP